jgi:hypothetical protein
MERIFVGCQFRRDRPRRRSVHSASDHAHLIVLLMVHPHRRDNFIYQPPDGGVINGAG